MASYQRGYRRDDRPQRYEQRDRDRFLRECNKITFKCSDGTKYKLNFIDTTTKDTDNNLLYNKRSKRYERFRLDLTKFDYQSSVSIKFNVNVSEDSEGNKVITTIPDQYKLSIDERPDFKYSTLRILNTIQLILLLSKVYYLTKNCNICDFIETFKNFVIRNIDMIITSNIRWMILIDANIKLPDFTVETKENLLEAINKLKCKGIENFDLKCTETNPINKHKRITLNKPAKDGSRPLDYMFGTIDAPVRLYYIDREYEGLDDYELTRRLNYSQLIKYSTLKFSINVIDDEIQPGKCKLILTGNHHSDNPLNNLLINERTRNKAFDIVFLSSEELLLLLIRVEYLIDMDKQIIDRRNPDKFNFSGENPLIKIAFIQRFFEFFNSNKEYINSNNIRWACIIDRQLMKYNDINILLENQIIIDRLLKIVLKDRNDILPFCFNSIAHPEGQENNIINQLQREAGIIIYGRREDDRNSLNKRTDEEILEEYRRKDQLLREKEEREKELREKEKEMKEQTVITQEEIDDIIAILNSGDEEKIKQAISRLTNEQIEQIDNNLSFMQKRKLNRFYSIIQIEKITGMTIKDIEKNILPDNKEQIEHLASVLSKDFIPYLPISISTIVFKCKISQELEKLTGLTLEDVNNIKADDIEKIEKLIPILRDDRYQYLTLHIKDEVLFNIEKHIKKQPPTQTGGNTYNYINMYKSMYYKYLSFIQKYNYF